MTRIERLGNDRAKITALAWWHFEQWGELVGFASRAAYCEALGQWSAGQEVPAVLVAVDGDEVQGSVTVRESEMTVRPLLGPWLSQLFVVSRYRRRGLGAALVSAATEHARALGFREIYLFTSGTLPAFYAGLGWKERERVLYLGQERVVMQYDLTAAGR